MRIVGLRFSTQFHKLFSFQTTSMANARETPDVVHDAEQHELCEKVLQALGDCGKDLSSVHKAHHEDLHRLEEKLFAARNPTELVDTFKSQIVKARLLLAQVQITSVNMSLKHRHLCNERDQYECAIGHELPPEDVRPRRRNIRQRSAASSSDEETFGSSVENEQAESEV